MVNPQVSPRAGGTYEYFNWLFFKKASTQSLPNYSGKIMQFVGAPSNCTVATANHCVSFCAGEPADAVRSAIKSAKKTLSSTPYGHGAIAFQFAQAS